MRGCGLITSMSDESLWAGDLHAFVVTGSGGFPFEALCEEACWPLTYRDAAAMTESGERSVRLLTWSDGPKQQRWPSGWTITTDNGKPPS
jgi:hypothetical protein